MLDLSKMRKRLGEVLETETPESFEIWLRDFRIRESFLKPERVFVEISRSFSVEELPDVYHSFYSGEIESSTSEIIFQVDFQRAA